MKEVMPYLFVGDAGDWEYVRKSLVKGAVLHAAKEPWHREFVGYSGRGAPKDSPEYLWALRGNELALNLVDADDPKYIPHEVIERGLAFIGEHLAAGRKVLVHCNQGQSRAPGIAFLYMDRVGKLQKDLHTALKQFRELYPEFLPAAGIMGYIEFHFGSHGGE